MRGRRHRDRSSCVWWQLLLAEMNTADGVPGDVLLLVTLQGVVVPCVPPRSAHTVYLCVLCGSQNKQRLFPYTALTDWFL
jgi:hypothetical protein